MIVPVVPVFILRETRNKNIRTRVKTRARMRPERTLRSIHEIAPLKCVCFQIIITRARAKIFSIKVRESV